MSETDTETADEDPDDSEKPEITDDETAEIDIDVSAEDIEDDAGQSTAEDTETTDDEADESDGTRPTMDAGPPTDTWGDMYCEGLATITTIAKQEAGDGGEVTADRARELHLDEYFDEFVRSRGKSEDMPPEQALVVGTCMFLMGTLATDSELLENALSEVTA